MLVRQNLAFMVHVHFSAVQNFGENQGSLAALAMTGGLENIHPDVIQLTTAVPGGSTVADEVMVSFCKRG